MPKTVLRMRGYHWSKYARKTRVRKRKSTKVQNISDPDRDLAGTDFEVDRGALFTPEIGSRGRRRRDLGHRIRPVAATAGDEGGSGGDAEAEAGRRGCRRRGRRGRRLGCASPELLPGGGGSAGLGEDEGGAGGGDSGPVGREVF